jgi:hypothetical protein
LALLALGRRLLRTADRGDGSVALRRRGVLAARTALDRAVPLGGPDSAAGLVGSAATVLDAPSAREGALLR